MQPRFEATIEIELDIDRPTFGSALERAEERADALGDGIDFTIKKIERK